MKVVQNASLQALNRFRVAATAGLLVTIESEEDLLSLPPLDPQRDLVLGDGSNVVLASDIPGTVYRVRIPGRAIVERSAEHALVEVGAGEDWHRLVRWTLDRGLSGLENLSLIPGLAGAAPIQNIGAYGVELAAVLESVTAWDWQRCRWTRLSAAECRLGYRDSLFKSIAPDRYLITSIRLRLDRNFQAQLEYAGLREELQAMGIDKPSPKNVADAVVRIRRRRLPDPAMIGNAGSFFKNPVVDATQARQLADSHPGLPCWPAENGRMKLSAAWLIERAGAKHLREGDAAVSQQHTLVLVNEGMASGTQVLALAHKIQTLISDRFGIELEIEPRVVEF